MSPRKKIPKSNISLFSVICTSPTHEVGSKYKCKEEVQGSHLRATNLSPEDQLLGWKRKSEGCGRDSIV